MSDPAASATSAHLQDVFTALGWASSGPLLQRVVTDVVAAFQGRWPGYLANDMLYHDLGHTLQAAVCTADLVAGVARSGEASAFGQRSGELSVIAALLHDSGFLKLAGDLSGTGAKYTLVHERRSCDFAQRYLPPLGFTASEVEDVCAAISCTGPRNRISDHAFRDATAHRIACLLVTADYLAQVASPNYPEKLDHLYAEFVEAFDHEGVPRERRPYGSALELRRKTADFWHKLVRPMLDTEAGAVHRFLAHPGQPNPYLQAVDANLAEIDRRLDGNLVQV